MNTEAESKFTHLTLKTRVYLTTPLCVSTLQTRISVMLDAAFSCGHVWAIEGDPQACVVVVAPI